MSDPTFSVIMPVWNRSHSVGKAIESVLAQTFKDLELLIVDDGSDDGFEEAVRPFLGPGVGCLRIPHGGVSVARNAGIRKTTGRFIAYLDSDNTWRPNFLERMKAALDEDGGNRLVAYAIAQVHECNGRLHPAGLKMAGEPPSLRTLASRNQIDLNTVVHSRQCLEMVESYDKSLRRLVDWDFLGRLIARYEPIFVPEVLVDYNWGLENNAVSLTENLGTAIGPCPGNSLKKWPTQKQSPFDTTWLTTSGTIFRTKNTTIGFGSEMVRMT
jgi:glycosyltransferase involved in cell wall biosynthesis